MLCFIYRSNKKDNTYLYIAKRDDFDCLPEGMLQLFGAPEYSMSIDLTSDKKLAQEDTQEVLDKLEAEGYYLQLPKNDHYVQDIEAKIIDSINKDK